MPLHPTRRSLRDRFLVVVLFAAVLPLAGIGLWLTTAAARAGEELRREQLREALDQLERGVGERWTFALADLIWLGENEPTRRALVAEGAGLPPELPWLLDQSAPGIASLRYYDLAGRMRGEVVRADPFQSSQRSGTRAPARGSTFPVRVPITDYETGRRIGEIEAEIRLASVLSADTTTSTPPGVALAVLDGAGSPLLVPDSLPAGQLRLGRFSLGEDEWVAEARTLSGLPLQLALAAPREPFVAPFERTARTGMLALLVVCLTALAITAALTTRLTRSLTRLAIAADAVAAGELDRRVETEGADEVSRLGAAFNTMTDSLRRTLEQLAQRRALAAVGEFATSLSHEIRNAHTSVRLDLQRARRRIPEGAPARELIERALAHVERLDRTVTGSLRVARSGRIDAVSIDLREPLAAAVESARAAATARGIEIHARLPDAPIALRGDDGALEHLLLNLLVNALEASPDHAAVEAELRRSGDHASIVVADRGAGIEVADLERVFEPFHSTKSTGTGLGLAIARSIAEAHGGRLELTPRPGGGTVASLSLPISSPAPLPPA